MDPPTYPFEETSFMDFILILSWFYLNQVSKSKALNCFWDITDPNYSSLCQSKIQKILAVHSVRIDFASEIESISVELGIQYKS